MPVIDALAGDPSGVRSAVLCVLVLAGMRTACSSASSSHVPRLAHAEAREQQPDAFEIDPAFSEERLAAAPSGWPTPDWSTVPTFAFCGPSSRPFRDAPDELQFFAGTNKTRRRLRFYALGYDTLTGYSNASLGFIGQDPSITNSQCGGCNDAQAKQQYIAEQVRSVAPDLPIWGGTAYQEMLCDYPKPGPPPPPPCSGAMGHTVCGCSVDGGTVALTCPNGKFTAVEFASVGTPSGTCGNFTVGKCSGDPPTAKAAVAKLCVSRASCKVSADINVLNGGKDPCNGVVKSTYVALTCSTAAPPSPPTPLPAPSLIRPCMMENDDKMRQSCGWNGSHFTVLGDECGIMQCGGKVVRTARSDGHTIHGFQNAVGRKLWADIFSNWSKAGVMTGVIWDGIWAGGGPNGECNASEHAAFWKGAEEGVRMARQANGWDHPAVCNAGGEGITNLTFSDNSGPMCSGSLFERYGRDGLWDVYSLWVTSTWQVPYIVVIRGMDKTHTGDVRQFSEQAGFQANLASFVTVAGPHSYFLQFWQYGCLPPSTQIIEPPNNEYMRPLGTPGPTQLLAGVANASLMPSSDGKHLVPVPHAGAFERWDNCDRLISSGAGGFQPWQSMLTCVFSRKFASGTRSYYNGSAFRVYNDSIGADGKLHFSHGLSTAACILWSDGAETGTTSGCSYRGDNWPNGSPRIGCNTMTACEEAKAFFKQTGDLANGL